MTETLPPVIPATPDIEDSWSYGVAGKKIAYTIAKWKASVAGGVALGPVFYSLVEQINGMTSQFGVSIHVVEPVFEKMLPVLLFSGLIALHDFAKVKFQDKPVAKFL